ncbi:MAG: hypothetical protein JRJ87_23125 [Deltaproteobacteria bacterium]|nr:hypothetical protein [Deltaproteobacteria bacterium]
MMINTCGNNTIGKIGQIPTISWLVLLVCMLPSCHRMSSPGDGDPRLPAAYRTPEKTFATWQAATVAGNRLAIRDCYWQDMSAQELAAWMTENLRPAAKKFLGQAKLIGVQPVTRVEVNFTFVTADDSEVRGVMVLTRQGWKIQRW